MYETKTVAKSAMTIMIFTLLSKLLGFLREVLIASKFGSGIETDAYFVANTACNFIIGVIGYSLTITLIPIISNMSGERLHTTKITHNSSNSLKCNTNINNYMNSIVNITILFSLAISITTWFISPILIKLLAKGFEGEQFILAVKLTKIGVPIIILTACNSIFSGFLQGNQKFNINAAIGIPSNVIFIIFLIFFSQSFGIEGLMVASVIAMLTQLLLQLYSAYKIKYSYKMKIKSKDEYVKNTFYMIIPVILGSMVNKINTVVDKTLASELVNGSISSLNYSNIINSLILNIFVIGITTVIYPILSKEFMKKNIKSIKIILKKSINIILIVIIPTTIGIMILSKPLIILFYERGAFDSNATKMTSLALVFYSIGLVGISIRNILDKTFYSFKDTKTPMINGILTVVVNIILNLALVRFMAHLGLALATSIAEIFGAMLLIISLRKKIGSFSIKFYSKFLMKLGLSASIMGVIVYFTYNSLDYMNYNFIFRLITLLIIILIGAIIYIFLCYILRIEEVKVFFKYIKRRCL